MQKEHLIPFAKSYGHEGDTSLYVQEHQSNATLDTTHILKQE